MCKHPWEFMLSLNFISILELTWKIRNPETFATTNALTNILYFINDVFTAFSSERI